MLINRVACSDPQGLALDTRKTSGSRSLTSPLYRGELLQTPGCVTASKAFGGFCICLEDLRVRPGPHSESSRRKVSAEQNSVSEQICEVSALCLGRPAVLRPGLLTWALPVLSNAPSNWPSLDWCQPEGLAAVWLRSECPVAKSRHPYTFKAASGEWLESTNEKLGQGRKLLHQAHACFLLRPNLTAELTAKG